MTNFVTIKQAEAEHKGNLIVKVIAVSDITSGSSWRKQTATLKDNSGTIEFTMWGDDIGTLDQGQHYKIEGPFWKEYNGKWTPQHGKYTKYHLATPEELIPADAVPQETEATPQPPTEASPDDLPKLPELPKEIREFVKSKGIEMLQIEIVMREVVQEYNPREANNGQKIGMMTKTMFEFMHQKPGVKA